MSKQTFTDIEILAHKLADLEHVLGTSFNRETAFYDEILDAWERFRDSIDAEIYFGSEFYDVYKRRRREREEQDECGRPFVVIDGGK